MQVQIPSNDLIISLKNSNYAEMYDSLHDANENISQKQPLIKTIKNRV